MGLRDFAESLEFGERAQRWADAFYFGAPGQRGSLPFGQTFGVDGVGLIRRNHRDYIALLAPLERGAVEYPLYETPLEAPQSDEIIFGAIRAAFPQDSLDQVCILRIPPIIRHVAAGTAVYGGMQGTAGPAVTWASGRTGFLTAGHVAAGVTQVTDASGTTIFGKTIHAFDPATPSGGGAPNMDVALIESSSGSAVTFFTKGSALHGSSPIDLHLTKGLRASTVLGLISWYVWPGAGGTYADLYMTNAACTAPGDSGAAVTMSGSSAAIGTVVGGTKTFSSFIQNIHRQIAALQTVTGLGALSL